MVSPHLLLLLLASPAALPLTVQRRGLLQFPPAAGPFVADPFGLRRDNLSGERNAVYPHQGGSLPTAPPPPSSPVYIPGHSYPGANVEMGEIPDGAIPVGGFSDMGQAKDNKFLLSEWSEGPGLKCSQKECLGMSSPAMPGLVHASFKGISVKLKDAIKHYKKDRAGARKQLKAAYGDYRKARLAQYKALKEKVAKSAAAAKEGDAAARAR